MGKYFKHIHLNVKNINELMQLQLNFLKPYMYLENVFLLWLLALKRWNNTFPWLPVSGISKESLLELFGRKLAGKCLPEICPLWRVTQLLVSLVWALAVSLFFIPTLKVPSRGLSCCLVAALWHCLMVMLHG